MRSERNGVHGERFLNEPLIVRLVTALTQVVDDGEGAGLGVGERALEPLESLGVLTVHHADHLLQRHWSTRQQTTGRGSSLLSDRYLELRESDYYSALLTYRPTTLLYYYHIPTSRHARLLLRGPPVQRVRHHLDLGGTGTVQRPRRPRDLHDIHAGCGKEGQTEREKETCRHPQFSCRSPAGATRETTE